MTETVKLFLTHFISKDSTVCPSVCHTHKPRPNGSRYRNILYTVR